MIRLHSLSSGGRGRWVIMVLCWSRNKISESSGRKCAGKEPRTASEKAELWCNIPLHNLHFLHDVGNMEFSWNAAFLLSKSFAHLLCGVNKCKVLSHFRFFPTVSLRYKKIRETFESDCSVLTQDSSRGYPEYVSGNLSSRKHSRNEIFNYKASVMAVKVIHHCRVNDKLFLAFRQRVRVTEANFHAFHLTNILESILCEQDSGVICLYRYLGVIESKYFLSK
jgi:hypothetical protein